MEVSEEKRFAVHKDVIDIDHSAGLTYILQLRWDVQRELQESTRSRAGGDVDRVLGRSERHDEVVDVSELYLIAVRVDLPYLAGMCAEDKRGSSPSHRGTHRGLGKFNQTASAVLVLSRQQKDAATVCDARGEVAVRRGGDRVGPAEDRWLQRH
ncbi:hypothetical protein HDA40_002649 [Hamadaea flava]|uniref:Uncharacterized protein n=1 Tax=Hamadaea flava TaxID=1742688 RepID=A0ABV8LL29_9ACTN|nr:hypothetical protein [Hamadaea flava]MCP2324142.1 hypothetical protein [Hamadaea flava]